jgi:cytochrome c peroxidase
VPISDRGRADGIQRFLKSEFSAAGPYSDSPRGDPPAISETPADVGAFLTPTLRSVSRSAPYMHTGSFATLWDVLVFYRDGAGTDGFSGTIDPARRPLRLSDRDLEDLIEFLKSLDGAPLPRELIVKPVLP